MSAVGEWIRRFLGFGTKADRGAVSAHREAHPVAWSSMAEFLENLEALAKEFPELLDTDVRERMFEIVQRQLLELTEAVSVPADLGMFTPEGNRRLQELLTVNISSLREVFELFELDTVQKRKVTFFNPKVQTEGGARVEDFFGQP